MIRFQWTSSRSAAGTQCILYRRLGCRVPPPQRRGYRCCALGESLGDAAAYLQYLYIRRNENPIGSKDQLDTAADASAYSTAHAQYHQILRSFLKKFGLYDIFLVDAETGNVVYTVFKEIDFGTSLRTGSFADTSLGRVFRQAASSNRRDAVFFGAFGPYLPSFTRQQASLRHRS